MPYVNFPKESTNALHQRFGVDIESGTHSTDNGTLGAVLSRYLPEKDMGLAVSIARKYGARRISSHYETPTPKTTETVQNGFDFLENSNLYDETSHLNPDGSRKRRR